jgi:hypothetical protein
MWRNERQTLRMVAIFAIGAVLVAILTHRTGASPF